MAGDATASGRPSSGDLIDGKYRIESLLGQGGMGAVYRAAHVHTGRVVALKVISQAPPLALIFGPQILSILGLFAIQGAIVPAVMQAIVTPLQPIDLRVLHSVFRVRMRGYLRSIAPVVGVLALFSGWVSLVIWALPTVLGPLRPFLRALPRPLAVLVLLSMVMPITAGPMS